MSTVSNKNKIRILSNNNNVEKTKTPLTKTKAHD